MVISVLLEEVTIVVEQAKALALNLKNPESIATIPAAAAMKFNNTEFVVVPHKIDEVRVLRNLGIKAPSPYLLYRSRYKPYEHQRMTSVFLTMYKKALY